MGTSPLVVVQGPRLLSLYFIWQRMNLICLDQKLTWTFHLSLTLSVIFQILVRSSDLPDLELYGPGQKDVIKCLLKLMQDVILCTIFVGKMPYFLYQLIHTNIALLDLYQCKKGVIRHSICTQKLLERMKNLMVNYQIMALVTRQTNLATEVCKNPYQKLVDIESMF